MTLFTFLTLEYSEKFLFSCFNFTQSSILQLKTKFWQFQKSVQCLTNITSKNFYFSYAFCLLTYCVSSNTSMLMHYWLQSLQLFWPVDVHSSRPLRCCITLDSLFWSKMADVPACTVTQFLNVHQYLHGPLFFFFARTFQDTNNILANLFLCTTPIIRHSERITCWRRSTCNFFRVYGVFVQLADCICIYYLWSSLGLCFYHSLKCTFFQRARLYIKWFMMEGK